MLTGTEDEGRSPISTIPTHCTVRCSKHLRFNTVKCERVSGTIWDTFDDIANGKGIKALGEITRGELSHYPHE